MEKYFPGMTNLPSKSERVQRMDIARGLGILLVVAGHNPASTSGSTAKLLIFSFHIPLFFFLSGYFHRQSEPIATDIMQRAKRLLIPYGLTGLLFIFYKALQNSPDFYERDLWQLLGGVLWGAGGSGTPVSFLYWPPVWFLTSLFITQSCFSLLQLKMVKTVMLTRIVIFTVFLFLGIYYLQHWGRNYVYIDNSPIVPNETGLPWNFDLLPITLFYYWLGWEIRKWKSFEQFLTQGSGTITLLISGSLFGIFHLLHIRVGHSEWLLDLNRRDYGHVVLTTLGAGIGIVMILALSGVIERYSARFLRKPLITLGMQSLMILVFHYFFQQEVHRLLAQDLPGQGWVVIAGSWGAGVAIPAMLYLLLLKKIPWICTVYGNPKTRS
ncbi:MAG: acyltransferase family protein [Opitutae bacterium]|jgi:polysaccharide biosynthesis protein PslL|nr:acyltransferase family protein [Opitutae bacterium]